MEQEPESYNNMRKAIAMLKVITQGEQDVMNGKTMSQEAVFANIEKTLKERLK